MLASLPTLPVTVVCATGAQSVVRTCGIGSEDASDKPVVQPAMGKQTKAYLSMVRSMLDLDLLSGGLDSKRDEKASLVDTYSHTNVSSDKT